MLTLGPYAQLMLVAAGFWIFVISAAMACIAAGAIGTRIARRHGRKCPCCDYQGKQVDVVIHHALEHERE